MTIFEDYCRALRKYLPSDQRDDIARELAEELQSQAVDKEAELGRPLTEKEQSAILRQYGHPLVLASRYWTQQSLIGPVVFPYYLIVLKVSLAWTAVIHAIGAGVLALRGAQAAEFGAVFERLLGNGLATFALLTLIAAAADRVLTRSGALERRGPGSDHPRRRSSVARLTPAPRALSRFVARVLLGVWWLGGIKYPALFFGAYAQDLTWGPAIHQLYPVLVVAQLLDLAEGWAKLTARQPSALVRRVASLARIATGVSFLYVVASSDRQWLQWEGGAADVSWLPITNLAFSAGFAFAGVASLLQVLHTLIGASRETGTRVETI
jgi:hypothetical protein